MVSIFADWEWGNNQEEKSNISKAFSNNIDGVAWKRFEVRDNDLEKNISLSGDRDLFLQIVVSHLGTFPSDAIN
jgi:hypothetical protein